MAAAVKTGGTPVGHSVGNLVGGVRRAQVPCREIAEETVAAMPIDEERIGSVAKQIVKGIGKNFQEYTKRANGSLVRATGLSGEDPFLAYCLKLRFVDRHGDGLKKLSEYVARADIAPNVMESARKVADCAVPFGVGGVVSCALQYCFGINIAPPLLLSTIAGGVGAAAGCLTDCVAPLTKENLVPRLLEVLLSSHRSLLSRYTISSLERIRDEGLLEGGTELDGLVAVFAVVFNNALDGAFPMLPYGMEGFPEVSSTENIYNLLRIKSMKQLLYAFLGEVSKDKEPIQLFRIMLKLLTKRDLPSVMQKLADSLLEENIEHLPLFETCSKEAWPTDCERFLPSLNVAFLKSHSLPQLKKGCLASSERIHESLIASMAHERVAIYEQMGRLTTGESLFSEGNQAAIRKIAVNMAKMQLNGAGLFKRLSRALGDECDFLKSATHDKRPTSELNELKRQFIKDMVEKVSGLLSDPKLLLLKNSLKETKSRPSEKEIREIQTRYKEISESLSEILDLSRVLENMGFDMPKSVDKLRQELGELHHLYDVAKPHLPTLAPPTALSFVGSPFWLRH